MPLIVFAFALALPQVAAAASGGSQFVAIPKITKVACAKDCAGKKGKRTPRGGSLIRIKGSELTSAKQIVFLGSRGTDDDTTASPVTARANVATVRVPADTASGPIVAVTATGERSKASSSIPILPQPPVIGTPELKNVPTDVPGAKLEAGTSTPRTVFLGAKDLVRFSIRVSGISGAQVAVTLTRKSTGQAIADWTLAAPQGETVSVNWQGEANSKPAAAGRYSFSVRIITGETAASVQKQSTDDTRDAFDLYGFMYPIRGKHNNGMSAGRFGGGRGHQGQDVMAKCGTKLVAARGGEVIESRSQSAAGNFIVIRPDAPGIGDQAYMHLVQRSPFRKGDTVYTGQQIGLVGRTGRASACHLHFEQWTGEIWRSKPVDPLPSLNAWDLVS